MINYFNKRIDICYPADHQTKFSKSIKWNKNITSKLSEPVLGFNSELKISGFVLKVKCDLKKL